MGFGGATAVVTGGSSGIGRAVARRLAGQGARVVIAARDRERGGAAVEEIGREGGAATFVRADVRVPAQVASLFEDVARDGGGVDYLFNNAGYEGPVAPLHELPAGEVDRLVDTNLKGVIHVLREGIPHVSQGGCVVNNSSFLGTVPFPGGPVYAATKSAVIQLTESVAETYGGDGVRAYAVCPFNTDTPMIRRLAETGAVTLEQLAGMNPSGKLGDPEDVASVVADLMAGRRAEPSGSALLVDHGPAVERLA